MRSDFGVSFRTVLFIAVAAAGVETASFSGAPADGIVNLPMALPVVKPSLPQGVVEDAPLRTFRIGRESRPAQAVAGPQTLKHTVTIPTGGGRFETALAPLKDRASLDVLLDGAKATTITAAPGAWTPVLVDLPADRGTVTIEERLTVPANSPVLWSDDRIAPAVASRRPDVLLITLDTTRPDYLTLYSPKETTTPTLAQLAREGTRFDQAISVSSWTLPSHAALMTGQFPDVDLRYGRLVKRLEPVQVTLAEIFAAAGYTAHGASGGPYTDSAFGFQQGFRSYLDSAEPKNAVGVTQWAIDQITQEKRGAPLFLFLNYFDAHEPSSNMTTAEWQALYYGKAAVTASTAARLRAGYRDDLHRIDLELSKLFAAMRRSRDWQNTIVVVAADHGQLLGERGLVGHGLTLEEQLIRVPLVIKPAASAPLRRAVYKEQVQLTDVFDLTLQLAGMTSASGGSLVNRIAAGQPLRTATYAQVRVEPTPELKALPRFRSEMLSAIRTDSAKVVLDSQGRPAALRISGEQEMAMPIQDRLPQMLLADLQRFLHDQPVASDAGALKVPSDVLERLRALGYIR